ncbi:conserved hypothetical protein [Ricinus communis]|uniref:Uncharacterized protein n=1 Tax=Ricinus communis TaxID=3988 RepID=B9S354_RICCO|nr:conserved hypothetical protein [Ricinus communis]
MEMERKGGVLFQLPQLGFWVMFNCCSRAKQSREGTLCLAKANEYMATLGSLLLRTLLKLRLLHPPSVMEQKLYATECSGLRKWDKLQS